MHSERLINTKRSMYVLKYKDALCELMSSENDPVVFVHTISGICASETFNHFWDLKFFNHFGNYFISKNKYWSYRGHFPWT